jgi:mannose-1-phosphate guanylyltransferase/mannose-6-phosphate isomerase
MIIPVVLAGGVGSRLWPVSRQLYPKQFSSLAASKSKSDIGSNAGETLFQTTLTRIRGVADLGAPLVICNEEHRFLSAQQLLEIGETQGTILLEPIGRNTAPAVALAALIAAPNDVLLVLPSDHAIANHQALQTVVENGAAMARAGKLVTFGIVPRTPETGYGYIQRGAQVGPGFDVQRFVEKPALETAQGYLDSGDYYWNSGMFMFTAEQFLAELAVHAPDILEACKAAVAQIEPDVDFRRIPLELFSKCRAESIDYAVMEHTRAAVVLPLDAQWNDLGAWDALWETSAQDGEGNVLTGDVLCEGVSNSYIRSHSRLIAAVGIDNAIIVETADAVLVADRDSVQDVKRIVQRLEKEGRSEGVSHVLVYRPWGSYESLAVGEGYQVKHIVVKPGGSLSLQMHHHRAEHWVVIKGSATVTNGERVFTLQANESTFIPLGSKHRLQNLGEEPVELIEVQTGSYLAEDDIVRFEDIYGRVKKTE